MLRIATFNVNSVRARLGNLATWLQTAQPDIVFLQEIKVETALFPTAEVSDMGYASLVHGQKSYNGVATLFKPEIDLKLVSNSLLADDPLARYLEAALPDGTHLINIYAPNGNPLGSDKFTYKLAWLAALEARAKALLASETPFLIAGDFNIIPTVEDCVTPADWMGDALFQPESRDAWQRLCHLGLTDAFRALHPTAQRAFTFWDYQAGAWQRDNGIRIDHALLSPQLADRLQAVEIDKTPRAADKASDHTPLIVSFF